MVTTIDIIIFGFLLKEPMSAYELVQRVSKEHVDRFLKISTPAIYKSCKRLHAAGLLVAENSKQGEQAEKTIYSINPRGSEQFFTGMERLAAQFTPFYLDVNVLVWNLDNLDKKQGLVLLTRLHKTIANFKGWVIQHEQTEYPHLSFAQRAIIKQYRMTISALVDWCDETIKEYKKG